MNRTIRQLGEATRQLRKQLPYFPQALQLVRQAAGGLTIIWAVLILVQGLLPVATVYLTRALVDGIASIIGTGGGWASLLPLAPA